MSDNVADVNALSFAVPNFFAFAECHGGSRHCNGGPLTDSDAYSDTRAGYSMR